MAARKSNVAESDHYGQACRVDCLQIFHRNLLGSRQGNNVLQILTPHGLLRTDILLDLRKLGGYGIPDTTGFCHKHQ